MDALERRHTRSVIVVMRCLRVSPAARGVSSACFCFCDSKPILTIKAHGSSHLVSTRRYAVSVGLGVR